MQVKLFTIVFVIYHTCKKYLNTQLYFTAFCEYKSRSFWCNLSFVDTSLFICLVKRLPPLSLGKTHCNYENKKICSVYFLQSISSSKNSGSNIWWIERRLQRAYSAAAVNEKEFYVRKMQSEPGKWLEGRAREFYSSTVSDFFQLKLRSRKITLSSA